MTLFFLQKMNFFNAKLKTWELLRLKYNSADSLSSQLKSIDVLDQGCQTQTS